MARIYTRTGDDGTTGLCDGSRVAKVDARVHAMGEVDELNSWIGRMIAEIPRDSDIRDMLISIQSRLFEYGAELALAGKGRIGSQHITQLETEIDHISDTLPELKSFILPGGAPAACTCHIARSVCRRTERSLLNLPAEESSLEARQYFNRLSDLLFVFARQINRDEGYGEIRWEPEEH